MVETTNVMYDTRIIVFADGEEAQAAYEAMTGRTPAGYSWKYQIDLIGDTKLETQIGQGIEKLVNQAQCDGYVEVRENNKASLYQMYGTIMFLGIFVGTLFLMGAVMIIYYKQISEGYEDQGRFQIMQKVGMSRREVKGAIRRQILLVFFIPLVMAMVHISMAFPLIRRLLLLFGMANTKLYVGCTAGTVLAFALVYGLIYSMTARSYYKIVEKA